MKDSTNLLGPCQVDFLFKKKNTLGPRSSIVYFIPLQSKPVKGLIEFFPIFFSILFKFSNW